MISLKKMSKDKGIQVPVAIYKYQADGIDKQEEIHVSKYDPRIHKGKIYCPVCCGVLHYVNGAHRSQDGVRMHFRHKDAEIVRNSTKSDVIERDCLWHKWSQQVFPKRYHEKVFHITNNRKIIADIMFDNSSSIEFQNSKITEQNIRKRESNYPDMVWVVNGTKNKFYILGGGYYLMKMSTSNSWWMFLDSNRLYVDTGYDGIGFIMKVVFIIKYGYVILTKIGNYRDLLIHLNIQGVDLNEIMVDYDERLKKDRIAIISKRERSTANEQPGIVDVLECHYPSRRLTIKLNDMRDIDFWKERYFKAQGNLMIYDESIIYQTDISYENRCKKAVESCFFYEIDDELIYSTGDYVNDLKSYAKRNGIKLSQQYINEAIEEHAALYHKRLTEYFSSGWLNIELKLEKDNGKKTLKKVIIDIMRQKIRDANQLQSYLLDNELVCYDFMLPGLLNYRKNRVLSLLTDYLGNDKVILKDITDADNVTFVNLIYDKKSCHLCHQVHYKKFPIIYFNHRDYEIMYKCNLRNMNDYVGNLF